MSYFKVLSAKLPCSIQELGRFGFGDIGVTQSGVMDEEAFNYLNLLLQNSYNTNALEINYGNLELESFGSSIFCITGADVPIELNGKSLKSYTTYKIKKGDILKIGFAKSGVRAYLGVKGGFIAQKELGSYSYSFREDIGGAILKEGDILKFNTFKDFNNIKKRELSRAFIPKIESLTTLRVVLGYQEDLFTKEQKELFFSSIYTITNQNDRMGYRLDGNTILPQKKGIISEGVAFGSIQITSNGEPIVLLKERQSIGGYPKIGSVIPTDCFKLSQLKQSQKVKFEEISLDKALDITKKFYNFFIRHQ